MTKGQANPWRDGSFSGVLGGMMGMFVISVPLQLVAITGLMGMHNTENVHGYFWNTSLKKWSNPRKITGMSPSDEDEDE